MAVDRVPWAVSTQGAEHSAALARVANFVSSRQLRGIVPAAGASGNTLPTSPASSSVRVMPMVAVCPNSYTSFGEAYVLRNLSQTLVPIRATGSGGGRSDVIIFRVDDPALGGGTVSDVTTHDFARFEVVENVPASVQTATALASNKGLNFPFVWIARVTLPASTATVQASHIDTSGRVRVGGMEETVTIPTTELNRHIITSKETDGHIWPSIGGQHTLRVPEWATRVRIQFDWIDVEHRGQLNAFGVRWVRFGGIDTKKFGFDTPVDTGLFNTDWKIVDEIAIPPAMRGTDVQVEARARLGQASALTQVQIRPTGATVLTATFTEGLD